MLSGLVGWCCRGLPVHSHSSPYLLCCPLPRESSLGSVRAWTPPLASPASAQDNRNSNLPLGGVGSVQPLQAFLTAAFLELLCTQNNQLGLGLSIQTAWMGSYRVKGLPRIFCLGSFSMLWIFWALSVITEDHLALSHQANMTVSRKKI